MRKWFPSLFILALGVLLRFFKLNIKATTTFVSQCLARKLVLLYTKYEDSLVGLLMFTSIFGVMVLPTGSEKSVFGKLRKPSFGLRWFLRGKRI